MQVRLVNVGSRPAAAELGALGNGRAAAPFKGRIVRSVALFETDDGLITELIPSWRGAKDENAGLREHAAAKAPARDGVPAVPLMPVEKGASRNLHQLRKVLQEVGGRKVQQEALVKHTVGSPMNPMRRKAWFQHVTNKYRMPLISCVLDVLTV